MNNCENCEQEHNGDYGSGRFCSSKCARGFSTKAKREEINEKVSNKLLGTNYLSDEVRKSNSLKHKKSMAKRRLDLIEGDVEFEELSVELKRMRVIYDQKECCNRCKLDRWLELPITLELEHIDGNNLNNCRGNLEMLCPNCHSQTLTWRGRGKQRTTQKVSDSTLIIALSKSSSIRQALLMVGLTPKGRNYERCHKLNESIVG